MQKMDLPGVQPLTSLLFLSQPTKRIQGLDRETNPPTPNTSEAARGGTWSNTDHKQNSGGQTLLLRGKKKNGQKLEVTARLSLPRYLQGSLSIAKTAA